MSMPLPTFIESIHNNYELQVAYKWLGLGLVISAAIVSNLGVNIQKLSHLKENTLPEDEQSKYYIRPLWILGMLLVILGSIGDFEALGFAPQALVASVGGSCTVLANVCFAHLWLKQPLSKNDTIGTCLIIVGAVLSAVVNRPDEQLTLETLEELFIRPRFLFYMLIMGITTGTIFMEIHRIIMLEKRTGRTYSILPYLYAVVSGIIGSFSVLLAKCASVLLILTFEGNNQFRYSTSYLFVGGMFFTLILQTDLLNRAIMTGDTLSVFPIFQCSWICCSVIGGIIFYERAKLFSATECFLLILALTFILVGIYLLSQHRQHDITERQRILDAPLKLRKDTYFTSVAPLSPQMSSFNNDNDDLRDLPYGSSRRDNFR